MLIGTCQQLKTNPILKLLNHSKNHICSPSVSLEHNHYKISPTQNECTEQAKHQYNNDTRIDQCLI